MKKRALSWCLALLIAGAAGMGGQRAAAATPAGRDVGMAALGVVNLTLLSVFFWQALRAKPTATQSPKSPEPSATPEAIPSAPLSPQDQVESQ